MLNYIKIAFLLLIGLPTALSAQESPIGKIFGPQQGLPQEEYYCVIEATDGTMYVSTDQGVFRIIGNEVTQHTTADGLTSNTVFKVMEDPKGRIWALTYDGGVCYFEGEQWVTPKWNESLMDINRATFPYHLMVTEKDYVLVDLIKVDFEIHGAFVNVSVVERITIPDEETECRLHALKINSESMEFNVTLSDFTSRFNDFRPVDIDFLKTGLYHS